VPLSPTPRAPRLSRAGLIVALYGGLTLASVVWGALRGRPNPFLLPGASPRTLAGLGVGAALGLVVVFLSRLATHRLQWARVLEQEFRHLLGPLALREVVLLAAASSIGEECFFRGALLPDAGLWGSSALFALPHVGPGARFLPWTATSFVVGLALGALFRWSGDLAGPIAAHFLINLLNLRHITREAW
jgi:membrane protease YdiL (CAAX protease family)